MSFGREKRLLLAALAAVAPLPLPFNQVISWVALLIFWTALAIFARRAAAGADRWLSGWAMNALALLYLPFFFSDLTLFWRGQVLQPLAHLALFTLTVKLFALKREQDKWHALLAIFFLFLASMGSSVHPSVVIYLVAVVALTVFTLVRFAGLHEAARAEGGAGSLERPPVAGFTVWAMAAAIVLAIPLFIVLPRLRQPYLVAPGVSGGSGPMTGFSDELTLDTVGRVRTSTAVAFRFVPDGPAPDLAEFRFRVAAYDTFRRGAWTRSMPGDRLVRRAVGGFFEIGEGRPRSWLRFWMRPTTSARLALPTQTVWLDLTVPAVVIDAAGAVSLMAQPNSAVTYRAGLARRPEQEWSILRQPPPTSAERDGSSVGARIAELAERVAGDAEPVEAAGRLERHLIRGYDYSLELLPGRESNPIERFLFETRQGHCEYFATALVLMLRSQGIPARLVTGYWGAEFNPLEEYFIVRQSNAHAWVEAYLPELGWQVFDPTPASGLPAEDDADWRRLAVQAYDFLLFRWDRYVLTYGFNDQAGLLLRLRSLWRSVWERFADAGDDGEAAPAPAAEESVESATAADPVDLSLWSRYRWAPLLAVLIALLVWLRRRRHHWGAVDAYRQLRRSMERRRAGVERSTPPLELQRRLERRCPEAGEPAARIVRLYLEESFAGRAPGGDQRAELRRDLRSVERRLRESA